MFINKKNEGKKSCDNVTFSRIPQTTWKVIDLRLLGYF
jgi:hypothetical protein